MEGKQQKRVLIMNLAVVAAVLLLALGAFLLAKTRPLRVSTPNAGALEAAEGIVFTMDGPTD